MNLAQFQKQFSEQVRCVVLSGDEPLQRLELQDWIRTQLRQWGYTERSSYQVTRGFEFDAVVSASDNLSLFAEKKITELHFDKLPDRSIQNQLTERLADIDQGSFYMISLPKMTKQQLSAKWLKTLTSSGLLVQIWPIEANHLARWVADRATSMGLKMTPSASQLLASLSEGNLLAARQDLDKLQLLCGDQLVDEEQVTQVASDQARYNVFELMDAALAGNSTKVVRMLSNLRREGVAELLVINQLYRECRQLANMSEHIAAGHTPASVTKQWRVFPKRVPIITAALQKVPGRVWQALVTRCAHLDQMAKGMTAGNIWDELTTCLMMMSGRQLFRRPR